MVIWYIFILWAFGMFLSFWSFGQFLLVLVIWSISSRFGELCQKNLATLSAGTTDRMRGLELALVNFGFVCKLPP
jgi:hypothetical protein